MKLDQCLKLDEERKEAIQAEIHCGDSMVLFGISFIERPMLISRLNLKLVQIGRKEIFQDIFSHMIEHISCTIEMHDQIDDI